MPEELTTVSGVLQKRDASKKKRLDISKKRVDAGFSKDLEEGSWLRLGS